MKSCAGVVYTSFYFRRDSTACQLFYHYGSQFQTVNHTIRVDAAFKAERSIGIQAVTTGRLTHPCRMEISTFDEDIRCSFRRTGIQSAKYARNAHGFFLLQIIRSRSLGLRSTSSNVTNGVPSGIVFTITSLPFILPASKQCNGCPESMDNVISDIHYIINRTHRSDAIYSATIPDFPLQSLLSR